MLQTDPCCELAEIKYADCWAPIHLSAVCRPWTNLTAPQHPAFPSIRPSTYLSVLPSFLGCWQFHQPILSVQLSVLPWLCWQLLGLMPSQCSAPSWPMKRCLHSLSRWTGSYSFSHCFSPSTFFLCSKLYFTRSQLATAQSLLFCDPFPVPIPHFFADHLVAGKLTDIKTGKGRQIRNIHSTLSKDSAQKLCQPSPKHPKTSFPSSLYPPWCTCT